MSEHPTRFFTSGYDYEARRKRGWKFWKWQVIAVSKYALDGYKPMSRVEYDNMSKDAALGYAKLLNDANRSDDEQ